MTFIERVLAEALDYKTKYNCTLDDALYDWEGTNSNGDWGLSNIEKEKVLWLFQYNNRSTAK
jgi:hypothetical protein